MRRKCRCAVRSAVPRAGPPCARGRPARSGVRTPPLAAAAPRRPRRVRVRGSGSGCSRYFTYGFTHSQITVTHRHARARVLTHVRERVSVYIPPVELASLPHDVATARICTFDRTRTSLHRSAGSLLHQRPSRHAPHRDSHDADRINRPVVSVGARDSQPLHHVHAR